MSEELTVQGNNTALMVSAQDIKELIQENMGGRLDVGSIDRIKVPAGGGIAFEVPTLDGEESVKTLTGVIIHKAFQNAYWSVGMDESDGGTPPDCVSRDSLYGVGTPGGSCLTCPLNQFGSDPKGGKGKACKNVLILFLQQPGNILPVAVYLPPTSISNAKKHMMRISSLGLPYYTLVHELTLEKTKNDAGIVYSMVKFGIKKLNDKGATNAEKYQLDAATIENIKEMRAAIVPALENIPIDNEINAEE